MVDIRSLKDRVRSRIHTAKDLLATMMTPAQSPSLEGKDYRKEGAIATAKCDHAYISYDYDCLVQKVTEHENYLTAEDHVITKGMKQREEWRRQMGQINKELSMAFPGDVVVNGLLSLISSLGVSVLIRFLV